MGKDETTVIEVNATNENEQPKPSKLQTAIEKYWLWEILALLASIALLAAIAGVLKHYNDKVAPNWTVNLHYKNKSTTFTLNTVAAVLGTFMRIAVLTPVIAAIGELKWLWYQKGRQLTDVQVFDGAKGPLGAVIMLWSLRGRSLACLGAVIVLGSLLLDTALQSLIVYELAPTATEGQATIARTFGDATHATSLDGGPGFGLGSDGSISAVYRGLFADLDATFFASPTCVTGNCTWDDFASLGYLSSCEDISNQVQAESFVDQVPLEGDDQSQFNSTDLTYLNYTIPGSSYNNTLSGRCEPIDAYGGCRYPFFSIQNLDFKRASTVVSFSILRGEWSRIDGNLTGVVNGSTVPGTWRNPYNLTSVSAMRCDIDTVIFRYSASVISSAISEHMFGVAKSDKPYNSAGEIMSIPQAWHTSKNGYTNDTIYGLDYHTYRTLAGNLLNTFKGTAAYGLLDGSPDQIQKNVQTSSSVIDATSWTSEKQFELVASNVAASLTQHIRRLGEANYGAEGQARGTALQTKSFVRVKWVWICAPALIILLSAIFLIGTIFLTDRKGATMLWKASGLAPFYHPLTKEGREQIAVAQSAKHAELIAEKLKVRWQETEAGGRFVPA